ncbi:MAG: hypothetical protein KBS83_09160, partial [Lachnospiraceae bacterium]|nr:hypothetical protein [Candidatus Equihabitans merdae]
ILLTDLFLEGILSFGSVVAGLSTAAGLGLVVLFRTNRDKKESVIIALLLYIISAVAGIILQAVGL